MISRWTAIVVIFGIALIHESAVATTKRAGAATDRMARELEETAAYLNREGPTMLDPVTRLVKTSAVGRIFTFHYTILRRDASDDQFKYYVRSRAVVAACKNKTMMEAMKDYNVTYRFSYMFPNATAPLDIDATYQECRSLDLAQ